MASNILLKPSYYGVTMEAQRPALNPYPVSKERALYYHYESNTLRYVDNDEVAVNASEAMSMGAKEIEALGGTGFERPSLMQQLKDSVAMTCHPSNAALSADSVVSAPSTEGVVSADVAALGDPTATCSRCGGIFHTAEYCRANIDTVRSTYRELNFMEKESVAAVKDRAQILINTLNDARRRVEAGLAGGNASHRQLDIALQRAEVGV